MKEIFQGNITKETADLVKELTRRGGDSEWSVIETIQEMDGETGDSYSLTVLLQDRKISSDIQSSDLAEAINTDIDSGKAIVVSYDGDVDHPFTDITQSVEFTPYMSASWGSVSINISGAIILTEDGLDFWGALNSN